ncbi:MAG TPA: serine/threonine-protein kinase [Gemmataceae bacterium]|nr:serine/threonine-protein kinase [Gemmataceae bacterium]
MPESFPGEIPATCPPSPRMELPPEAACHATSMPVAAPDTQANASTLPPSAEEAGGPIAEQAIREPASIAWPCIPGYEILGELGRGGMGVVYRARQVSLNRIVALKMILAGGHATAQDLARFRTEAEVVARLQHPHVVHIYEIGEQNGLPFFSLELCAGGSLASSLEQTPLPPTDAAKLVETLAQAVHVAHQAGIVHRDLKPANVLLASDGMPKITDFGLARKLNEVGQTASGAVMGTPSYMAPEQAGGRTREIGPATDIYALGAILYECLTGRPPFQAATALDTIMQVVAEEPVPPRELNPTSPRELEAICLKCLEKHPQKRYPSAAALAEDLARFREGEPVTALQSGLIDQLVGALDRVQLQAQFAIYGSLLLWLAPVMFLPEIWITLVILKPWPAPLLIFGQMGRAGGFLLLMGYYRGWRWRPQGAAERQLWAVWGGYLLACFALGLSGRVAYGFYDAGVELKFYQGLAVLGGLAFIALAVNFWGYCALIGLTFLGLAFVMAADLQWAPLEFGATWAVVLILLGVRLRQLGTRIRLEQGPDAIFATHR